ncbi:hypothetical protein [Psychrobacillus lasiicapitis]|uniref:Uncharacterized protein n=1 Tax=Psychrobacillus lasiicapitis TaxID=1636719 RepID=A0A544TA73_9BACI|nr:hypothetical protein [Psychrobacillus lasiicapitis]TQR14364.1 hypothetical protein FG382_07865 [Psychrobacillus lasiicapitis]GGA31994.1 hypothetical protein GCM10011384_21950 [Psychrobacillus lasiicapitis]
MPETVVIKVESCAGWEGLRRERLLITGSEVMDVGPLSECPEDAILERDLVGPIYFVHLFERIIKDHNGKKVKFEYEEVEDFD